MCASVEHLPHAKLGRGGLAGHMVVARPASAPGQAIEGLLDRLWQKTRPHIISTDRQYTCRVVYETIIVPPKTAATKIGKMLGRRQNFHPSAALSRDDHDAHSRAFALPLRRDGVHK